MPFNGPAGQVGVPDCGFRVEASAWPSTPYFVWVPHPSASFVAATGSAECVAAAPTTRVETAAFSQGAYSADDGVNSIVGRVWKLSRQPDGCRMVQRQIEEAANDHDRTRLTEELRGHVCEAVVCPNANYVLQCCIRSLKPKAVQFIIDEIMSSGHAVKMAMHRSGCRVTQRILEHCFPVQVAPLVEELLSHALVLSKHDYGNYVMQAVLEHGTPEHQRRLAALVRKHAAEMAAHRSACGVLIKALSEGESGDQMEIARTLESQPGLLKKMSSTRHGNVAVKRALHVLHA